MLERIEYEAAVDRQQLAGHEPGALAQQEHHRTGDVLRHLRAPSPNKPTPGLDPKGPPGRLFLSEFDIKKRLTAGQTSLTLAQEAIISPLAADWIILKGITIVRE